MQHQLDAHEAAIAGHDLDDNERTLRALVWYAITPMCLIGLGIIAWAIWTTVRWIAG